MNKGLHAVIGSPPCVAGLQRRSLHERERAGRGSNTAPDEVKNATSELAWDNQLNPRLIPRHLSRAAKGFLFMMTIECARCIRLGYELLLSSRNGRFPTTLLMHRRQLIPILPSHGQGTYPHDEMQDKEPSTSSLEHYTI